MTTQIAKLTDRALVSVQGPDARPFLNNLLTQNVEGLEPGLLRFAAMLSPPGRVLFDLFIAGQEAGVLLDVAADRRDALMQKLAMYRLRARVEIASDDRPIFVCWPDVTVGFVADPRTPLLGGRAYGVAQSVTTGAEDWDAHRLAVGVPDPAHDTGIDRAYPIEANFDLLNGIDFTKGCFIGQETTSRMKRRGEIRKRMLPVRFKNGIAPPGSEVLKGDLRVGELLTGRGSTAMALVRLDRLEGDLTVDGDGVEVDWPAWMPR